MQSALPCFAETKLYAVRGGRLFLGRQSGVTPQSMDRRPGPDHARAPASLMTRREVARDGKGNKPPPRLPLSSFGSNNVVTSETQNQKGRRAGRRHDAAARCRATERTGARREPGAARSRELLRAAI